MVLTPNAPLNLTTFPKALCHSTYREPGVVRYNSHSSPKRIEEALGPGRWRRVFLADIAWNTCRAKRKRLNPNKKRETLKSRKPNMEDLRQMPLSQIRSDF